MAVNRYFPGKSGHGTSLAALVVTVALLALWALDLSWVLSSRRIEEWLGPPRSAMDFAPLVSGAVCTLLVCAVVWPGVGRRLTLAAGIAVPMTVLTTSILLWPLPMGLFGYPVIVTEAIGILAVLALTALRCRTWQVLTVLALCFLATLSDYLREPTQLDLSTAGLMVLSGLVPGLYLRWWSTERKAGIRRVRAEERLAVARDLHDVVAHEVTGIVVRVQALRHVADRRPEVVQEALPEIEEAGARALESMRTMVSRLRDPTQAPPTTTPLHGLEELAAPAGSGHPEVSVRLEGPITELPAEVGTTVLRIAQESVTNALRHSRRASRVTVAVTAHDDVVIRVDDDGRRGGRGGGPSGGGHGLVGMTERARLLGGDLSAGPGPYGQGWVVSATIPVPVRGAR